MAKNKGIKPKSARKEPISPQSEAASSSTKPTLDENSFTNLRNKIQAKLQSSNRKPDKKATVNPTKTQPPRDVDQPLRGKKRASDGTVLSAAKSVLPRDTGTDNISETPDEDENELRKAMKELGGTEEDLELLAGADSDSEIEGAEILPTEDTSSKQGKTLTQGMSNILKEIALAQGLTSGIASQSETDEEPEREDEKRIESKAVPLLPSEIGKGKQAGRTRLKCEPRSAWFDTSSDVDLDKESKYAPKSESINQLHVFAKSLLKVENEAFSATQQSSSSQAFYNTVIASGTLSDKISALTLAVQESPLHNVSPLETLIALAGKRSRAQAIEVLRALKDLFAQGSMLPPNRRLYTFATQPELLAALSQVQSWNQGDKLPKGIAERNLICWAYEDLLKTRYFDILRILETWCNDEIEFSRSRAVSYVYELLKERPEQESNLLRLLINKLGDSVKKIASQASYLLMQLLLNHPAMKMVVISAIETDFLFRPGQSVHGQYYAVTTLNQTVLSVREEDTADKLLDIYFSLFTGLLKAGQMGNSNDDDKSEEVQQPVSLSRAQRQKKAQKKPETANQQGLELREKFISAILTGVNRAYPFVGAGQKSFNEHIDTLFRITHSANFNTSIQALILIQQLVSTYGAASDRFYRTLYESLLDPRLMTASKQQLYLNLLHRSLKADLNVKRVKAFIKRFLQILSLQDPSFVCAGYFLIKDLETVLPSLSTLIEQAEQDDDDEEEDFRDIDEDAPADMARNTEGLRPRLNRYDGYKRAPEHANADNSCAWEVLPFLAHFHPSVSVNADHYLQRTKLPGKPDLSLHTLIHFLDRFVYRNPKLTSNKMRGASIMQPMASDDTHAVLVTSTAGSGGLAVNSDEFRNKRATDVAADEAFFHKYFSTLGKDAKAKKTSKSTRFDDEDSTGDGDEDAVWKAMVDSARDLEGIESEDDIDTSDFDAEMDGDDDDASADEPSAYDLDEERNSEVDVEAGIFDDLDDEVSSLEQALSEDASSDESGFDGFGSQGEDPPETSTKKTNQQDRERRKKLKALPTFASAADYAKMLEDDDDEDMGLRKR